MKWYRTARTLAAVFLGLLLGATASGWHQQLCDEDFGTPAATAPLDCPLCALLHQKVSATETSTPSPPVLSFFGVSVLPPVLMFCGQHRTTRPPRGPPALFISGGLIPAKRLAP